MKYSLPMLVIATALLSACGGGGDDAPPATGPTPPPTPSPIAGSPPAPGATAVTVSGRVTFDLVPATVTNGRPRLDYANTVRRPSRFVVVELIDAGNQAVLASTRTNANGDYSVQAPIGRNAFVRASARMTVSGANTAPIAVVDNTNQRAQWAIDGARFSTSGSAVITQNLHATSGWNGSSYVAAQRAAGPFAIIDTIYNATQRIISVDSTIAFPPLTVNWSPNNIAASGNLTQGQITSSFFTASTNGSTVTREMYILGRADNDTDEYDAHVVTHEFGHYLQSAFSRDDSVGGPHGGNNDRLDMRVAFSEGWGNGWAGIALNNPVYVDTSQAGQGNGFTFNVSRGEGTNPGWFKESSVERMFWDLSNSGIGFGQVWATMRNGLTTTAALSSMHSFANALRLRVSANEASNTLRPTLAREAIALPTDAYGAGETNFGAPVIANLSPIYLRYGNLNSSLTNVCVGNAADPNREFNKAGQYRFVRVTLPTSGNRTISLVRTSSTTPSTDPDFTVYNNLGELFVADGTVNNSETATRSLPAGDYVLAVTDFNLFSNSGGNSNACFTLTVR